MSQQEQRAFRDLLQSAMREEAPPEVEQRLLHAFRSERRMSWKRVLVAGGIAAALMLTVSRWIERPQSVPPVERPAPVERAVLPLPKPSLAELPPQKPPRVEPVRVERVAPRQLRSRRELRTSFMPVAGGDFSAPFDRGQLVRVRLPRSAMSAFGLPVNPNRVAEMVSADVILGEDGLARAIRFVQ